jgi:hypothetical protein
LRRNRMPNRIRATAPAIINELTIWETALLRKDPQT